MSYIKYLLAGFKAPLNPPIYRTNFLYEAKKKAWVYKESICLSVWFSDKQTYRYTNMQLEIYFFFFYRDILLFAHNLLLVWACSSAVILWVEIAKIKRELFFFLKFFEPVYSCIKFSLIFFTLRRHERFFISVWSIVLISPPPLFSLSHIHFFLYFIDL